MISSLGRPVTTSCLTFLEACAHVLGPAPPSTTTQLTSLQIDPIISSTTLQRRTDFGNARMPAETPHLANSTPIRLFRSTSLHQTMTFFTAFFGDPVTLFSSQEKVFILQLGQHTLLFRYQCTGPDPKTAPSMTSYALFVVNVRVIRFEQ